MRLFSPTKTKFAEGNSLLQDKVKLLREIEKRHKEIEEFEDNLEPHKRKLIQEIEQLEIKSQSKKSLLLSEIKGLEERKAKALEPLTKFEEQLEYQRQELVEKEQELANEGSKLKAEKELIAQTKEFLVDEKTYLIEKRLELYEIQTKAISVKKQATESLFEVNKKWLEYHTTIKDSNTRILEKEKELEVRERGVSLDRESNIKAKEEIANERIALKDGYENLKRARDEILGRTT